MPEIDPRTPGAGPRAPLPTAERPPDLDTLVRGLERVVRDGLPATEETADPTLLSLRGIWARAIDPDDILSRVKALNALLRELIPRIPPYRGKDRPLAASILFKIAPAAGQLNLSQRRHRAAQAAPCNAGHFRQEVMPKILRQIARQLHEDSQNYIQPGPGMPPQEISGTSPSVTEEHLSSRDRAACEERVARLRAYVYGLRAELIALERLKAWPGEEHAAPKLEEARDSALREIGRLMHWSSAYLLDYGGAILQGDAEFRAEALPGLAGWRGELPPVVAGKVRLTAARHATREGFLRACREAGLTLGGSLG